MSKLVNLGSLCIDNVYRVPSITSDGVTLRCRSYDIFPGGKGLNQSLAARRAGIPVKHVGCIGENGLWLRELLDAEGVDVSDLRVGDGASGHAVIQVDDEGRNAIVIDSGTNFQIGDNDIDRALDAMVPGDWLLLQNEVNDTEKVLEMAYGCDALVAINIAPADGREKNYDLSKVSVLVVNEAESEALTGEADPDESLSALCTKLPLAHVVLTLGRDGLRYGKGEIRLSVPAFDVRAVDETGAGDAFVGYLMACLVRGVDIDNGLRLASAAGALAVQSEGAATSIPRAADVEAFSAR